jgi:hypothetical protein
MVKVVLIVFSCDAAGAAPASSAAPAAAEVAVKLRRVSFSRDRGFSFSHHSADAAPARMLALRQLRSSNWSERHSRDPECEIDTDLTFQ